MIEYIQIYGERNSGTNYLENLLKSNLNGIEVGYKYGWKHGRIYHKHLQNKSIENVLFLPIFKDPYAWLVSMNKKPHHAPHLYNMPFSDFIRHEWSCYRGQNYDKMKVNGPPQIEDEEMLWERDPVTNKRFENVIQLRNFKSRGYLHIKTYVNYFCQLRYEDLLKCPLEILKSIAEQFNLPLNENFINNNQYFGKDLKDTFDKKDFYIKKEYFKYFTQDDLDYVNSYLDEQLEEKMGYKIVKQLTYFY